MRHSRRAQHAARVTLSLVCFLAACAPNPAGNDADDNAGATGATGLWNGGGASDGFQTGGAGTNGAAESTDWAAIKPDADAILVSIVMHCEEPPAYPDFTTDEATFAEHRAAVLEFAHRLATYKVQFDYQSDWNFLKAMIAFDSGDGATNGKNLLRYLAEDLGFAIDPHAHESSYSYADVAYLAELNGVVPSGIVGGYIAAPPQTSNLETFWSPVGGTQYVSRSWQATALWGGGTGNHVNEESLHASGVWKPQDRGNPMEHDADAPLPNIGNFGGTWENLDLLLELRAAGKLSNGVHTCTIMTNQRDVITAGWTAAFAAELEKRRANTGIRWVTLSEVLEIWQAEYAGAANMLTYEDAAALGQ